MTKRYLTDKKKDNYYKKCTYEDYFRFAVGEVNVSKYNRKFLRAN